MIAVHAIIIYSKNTTTMRILNLFAITLFCVFMSSCKKDTPEQSFTLKISVETTPILKDYDYSISVKEDYGSRNFLSETANKTPQDFSTVVPTSSLMINLNTGKNVKWVIKAYKDNVLFKTHEAFGGGVSFKL
jgi:hypothetical protein